MNPRPLAPQASALIQAALHPELSIMRCHAADKDRCRRHSIALGLATCRRISLCRFPPRRSSQRRLQPRDLVARRGISQNPPTFSTAPRIASRDYSFTLPTRPVHKSTRRRPRLASTQRQSLSTHSSVTDPRSPASSWSLASLLSPLPALLLAFLLALPANQQASPRPVWLQPASLRQPASPPQPASLRRLASLRPASRPAWA